MLLSSTKDGEILEASTQTIDDCEIEILVYEKELYIPILPNKSGRTIQLKLRHPHNSDLDGRVIEHTKFFNLAKLDKKIDEMIALVSNDLETLH